MGNLSERLGKVRAKLLLVDPFFAAIALRMEWEADDKCPTAMTNGRSIKFGTEFCEKLSDSQLLAIARHEVGHIIGHDHIRGRGKNHIVWNIATDYRTNALLREHGESNLPDGHLYDKKYGGLAAEEIYHKLMDEFEKSAKKHGIKGNPEDGTGTFSGDIGGVADATGADGKPLDEAEAKAMANEVDIMVQQAAQAAKLMGHGSPMIDRILKSIRSEKVDWRSELANLFQSLCKDDYSWMRPHKSYLYRDIVLPSMCVPAPPMVGVVIDTSGSIGERELGVFLGEIESLISSTGAKAVVMSADDRVHNTEEFGRNDLPLTFTPKGHGGTDFRPAFKWFAENKPEIQAIAYLTDLCGAFPKNAPDIPVLWVATTDEEAPFGKTVRVKV